LRNEKARAKLRRTTVTQVLRHTPQPTLAELACWLLQFVAVVSISLPLSLLAIEIAVYEGAASQQGRGWEQKGEVANWKMLAPPYNNSDLILHKSHIAEN